VYKVITNGSGFTTLHSFSEEGLDNSLGWTNADGITPNAGLIISGSTLYGTAENGGRSGAGTVFKVNTDGTGFTTLRSFTGGGDGASPYAELVLSGNTLYGTTIGGGSSINGTVFKLNTDGTGYTTLHNFAGGSGGSSPYAGLLLSGNTLYGTANSGGSSDNGTVFKLNTDGTGFTTLHRFTASSGNTNSDGLHPVAGLFLSGNTLYGTAYSGGTWANGTLFAVNTDGTGFSTLHSFAPGSGSFPNLTNSDGASMWGGLVLSGNTLYGVAQQGSGSGSGTVFSLSFPPPQLTITISRFSVIFHE